MTLTFASVALAHDGEERAGTPWLKIALVGGGLLAGDVVREAYEVSIQA